MTYTSINEAWGGVSGSEMLEIPIGEPPKDIRKKLHPAHKKQIVRKIRGPDNKYYDQYHCNYYGAPCQQALNLNTQFNNQQKMVAQGYPPQYIPSFPNTGMFMSQGHPAMQGFPLAPQYPWYGPPRYDYMNYGHDISQQFYNNPWTHPEVAMDIYEYQKKHNKRNLPDKRKRIEHFNGSMNQPVNMNKITIIFLIFLFAMALVLCVVLVFLASSIKK